MTPTISVVVPAFDAERTIGPCVAALRRLQPAALEIIVVDDGSADRTAEVAEAAGARVLRLPCNAGPGVARNRGAELARGEYLAFTDADCVASEGWLGAHLALVRPEDCCAGTGPYSGTAEDGLVPQLMDLALRFNQRALPATLESAISSNLFVRREDFFSVGGFPEYRLPGATKACWGNEDQELAHLLVRHTGKPVRWVPDGGPRHGYRSTLRDYLVQQAHYAEAVLISYARFPELWRTRANYSRGGSALRAMSAWLAVAFPPAAVAFFVVHSPAVAFMIRAPDRSSAKLAVGVSAYPFHFLTSMAWTAGLLTGAFRGAAGLVGWRLAGAAR